MENKHTPGSWELMSPGNAVWACYVTSDAGLVATAHGATKEEAEANAARIAAAPDLLDALRLMVESAVPHPVEHPTMTAAWKVARAAIAKAEGK